MEYTVDYFINKFEAIPEDEWCVGTFRNKEGKCCALGHCGEGWLEDAVEANALHFIFEYNDFNVPNVNDYNRSSLEARHSIDGDTPKERILNALKMIKEKQNEKQV